MQDNIKVIRDLDVLHPDLIDAVQLIESNIIEQHKMPIKLFETGRTKERHQMLISGGKTPDMFSKQRFDLSIGLFATACSFVYYEDGRWSWNIRNAKVKRWLQVFGEMVLEKCPNLYWHGYNRIRTDYTVYELKHESIKSSA